MYKAITPEQPTSPRLKPWKIVRGKYRRIPIYTCSRNGRDAKLIRSYREDRRLFTTTSETRILALAKMLADTPHEPSPNLMGLSASLVSHPSSAGVPKVPRC